MAQCKSLSTCKYKQLKYCRIIRDIAHWYCIYRKCGCSVKHNIPTDIHDAVRRDMYLLLYIEEPK